MTVRPIATPARVLVLAALAAVGVLAMPSSSAQEGGGTGAVGWWSQRLGAAAKADDGVVEVAFAAETAQSVAAVDVVVPEAGGEVLLVLAEVGGSSTDRGGIDLCRITEGWEPANPGAFADRPAVECAETPPELGRDSVALEWTGSLTSLLGEAEPGATVGIALLPRGIPLAAGAPVTTPFQVDLGEATLRVLDASTPPAAPPTTAAPPAPPPAGPVPIDPGFVDPGFSTPDLGGSSGFDSGPLPALPETPAAAPPTTAAISEGDDFVALGPVDVTSGPGRPWWRLALLTPISLAGGFGAAAARRNLRERLAG